MWTLRRGEAGGLGVCPKYPVEGGGGTSLVNMSSAPNSSTVFVAVYDDLE